MALIPPHFINCVVAIGAREKRGETIWVASGFLYGHLISHHRAKDEKYVVGLVTNRHVLADKIFKDDAELIIRLNPSGRKKAQEFPLKLYDDVGIPVWTPHKNENIDVAAMPIDLAMLKKRRIPVRYFQSKRHIADIKKMKEIGITEGDFIYVLGFPLGLVGQRRNTVVVRNGVIASIQDAYAKYEVEFLADAQIFPGNSGGPVGSKPEGMFIEGTQGQNKSFLIGLVSSYVPYKDVAISKQTKKVRIIFEENSGLATIVPVDYIKATIKEAIKRQGVTP